MALLTNVCRLCLVTEDLVWVFDRKLPGIQNNCLKDIIFATSGVEIYQKDMISQRICTKCCQISMKMFQFREQSLKNDKILKNQYAELLKNAKVKLKIPNTDITITSEKVEAKKEVKNDTSNARYRIHPSVTALFKDNPQIRLPSVCLKLNIAPCVSLEMDAVEKYFRNRRLSIQKFSQLAMKSTSKVAKKKGSAKPINKPKTFEVLKVTPVGSDRSVDPLQVVSTRAAVKLGSTKENTDKLLPVNMKKYPEKSYKIVNMSKIVAQDNSKSSDDSDTSIRRKHLGLKRKLSTDDSSSEVEPKKPVFIESLGLTPKMKSNGDSTGTLYVDSNKSVPLHICDICNSVQYNAKDLKRHQLKHLRCQFCKMKFKTMVGKDSHIARYCRIKNMMNNLPAVDLEKIEFKLKVRRKYPEAFCNFPSLPGLELEKKNDSDNYLNVEKSTSLNVEKSTSVELEKKNDSNTCLNDENSTSLESTQKCAENPVLQSSDVIEIISDDEDSTPIRASELAAVVGETLIGSSKEKAVSAAVSSALSTGTKVISKSSAVTIVNTPTVSTAVPIANTTSLPTSTKRNLSESIIQRNSVPVTIQNKPASYLEQNSPSYVVKPEILIKNVSILDKFGPKATDTNVVKHLLSQLGRLHSDVTSQTELPKNDSIIVNKGNRTIELKNLRYLLFIYKIPVHINRGDFKISYKYEAPVVREKKLCLWNDLVAIDLRSSSVNVDRISSRTTSRIPDSKRTTASLNSNSRLTIPNPPELNNQIATVMPFSQTNTNSSGAPIIDLLDTRNTIISPSVPSIMSCIRTPNRTSITNDPCSFNSVSVDAGNAAVMTSCQINSNRSGALVIDTLGTRNTIISSSVPSVISCIQTPSISFTPNSTSITLDPCSVDSVIVDAGNAAISTPVSSEVSDTQKSTTNRIDTSGPPVFSIDAMNTDAGHVTVGSPMSSGTSRFQPSGISLTSNSSSVSRPLPFFIDTVVGNADISTLNLSEMSCIQLQNISSDPPSISSPAAFSVNVNVTAGNTTTSTSLGCTIAATTISEMSCFQPPNISLIPNSPSTSSPSAGSTNNINAIAENTTTDTSISSGIGCIPPSTSIPLSFPTTTDHQIPPISVEGACIPTNAGAATNTGPNISTSCENSKAINVPFTVQNALPISSSLTPISDPVTPISAALTPICAPVTPISATLTPISAPVTVTPFSAPVTPICVPVTVTPISDLLTPVSAPLDSSPALPSNALPTATVTEANSVSTDISVPVASSGAVAGRIGIRVKNLCELT